MPTSTLLLDDLQFGESPRWHDGRLWFSDILDGKVYTATMDGTRTVMADFGDGRPSGIGFLPGGDALIVDMGMPGIIRLDQYGERSIHAELGEVTVDLLNDMVVDAQGYAYVGSTGRNYFNGDPAVHPANVILVRPDGSYRVVAEEVETPNGPVISPDGSTYIVAESHAHQLTAFPIGVDHTLGERRQFADLGEVMPDGICIDREGAIWVASQTTRECVRVRDGGEVTDRIGFDFETIACALGGPDGHTLFVFGTTGEAAGPDRSSVLHIVTVAVGAAR